MIGGGLGVFGLPPSTLASFSLLKPFSICTATASRSASSKKAQQLQNHCFGSSIESVAMKTLDESDVGILCYISKLPGFRGVLKHRYSDFIVNEVDCDGNVVHLTSFDLPPEEFVFQRNEEKESKTLDSTIKKNFSAEIESFRSLAGVVDTESLKELLDLIVSGAKADDSYIVLSPDSDKSHRTEIHNFFKTNFTFLITDTLDGPDSCSKCIRVRFSSGSQSGQGRNSKKRKGRGNRENSKDDKPFDSRSSNNWPTDIGKFLRFHLYKENKDTQEALGLIGKMLGIQQRSFGIAGTKDKRSISTQRVTVFKQHAKRLAALNDRLIGIKVGNFCYVDEELVLGKLLGNRFTITLRGVAADYEDTIKASANELGRNGFINYFGLQRFGSGSVPTHFVGAALLRGEWKTAFGLILDPREGERDTIKEVREYYKESGDIDGTLRRLPRYLVAERAILQCLKKCPGNYLQALKAIPRTLRMMYVHSYQSYLWNHAASLRVQKYGNGAVALGDLVYCKGNSQEKLQEVLGTEPEDCSYSDTHDESGGVGEIPEVSLPEDKVHSVKVVDAEDLLTGEYTVDDIVLPLPGSRIFYPSNDIVQVYHDLARKDGISLTESTHNVKEFSITSMAGGYRRVFQQPVDFEWEILGYKDCNMPLAETDMDIIAKSRPAITGGSEIGSISYNNNCISESRNLGSRGAGSVDNHENIGEIEKLPQVESLCNLDAPLQTALKLSFTLPASSYATMAIRELLKTSTSVAYQKTLNLEG